MSGMPTAAQASQRTSSTPRTSTPTQRTPTPTQRTSTPEPTPEEEVLETAPAAAATNSLSILSDYTGFSSDEEWCVDDPTPTWHEISTPLSVNNNLGTNKRNKATKQKRVQKFAGEAPKPFEQEEQEAKRLAWQTKQKILEVQLEEIQVRLRDSKLKLKITENTLKLQEDTAQN